MDFFDRQEQARRNIVSLIAAVYLAVLLIFTGVSLHQHRYQDDRPQWALWNPQLFLGAAVGTLAVITIGSLVKTSELSQGGSSVATMLGGRLVNPNTTDPNERKLLNVVEEMAIASGVPVPQVYVMDQEEGINAFAAGHSTSDAAVSVTHGALKLLTRDELQGVIGHEFSHILNGDMRLNLRLMGLIFGILCLAVIGRVLLQTRGRSSRDRNPLPVLGLALLLIGWIGVFFGRLIQAAVSRQREFLADASSVQFTRNPEGLSHALQKIGRWSFGSRIESPHADQASHMFFGNGVSKPLFGLMATHPSIADRIRAIDANWDGNFPPIPKEQVEMVQRAAVDAFEREAAESSLMETMLGEAGLSSLAGAEHEARSEGRDAFSDTVSAAITAKRASESGRFPAPPVIAPGSLLAGVGVPTTAHLRYAEELRNAIPAGLQAAARDPLGACALIYCLLLSDDEAARQKQVAELTAATSAATVQETLRLWPQVAPVAARAKLPMVDLALSAVRHLSAAQYDQFSRALQALIESDNQVDLFEYVLQKIVLRHLDPHFRGARKPLVQYYALKPLAPDCAVLLSALARLGQDDPAAVEAGFQRGAGPLSYAAQVGLSLVPADQSDLARVDAVLNRLAQAAPQIKRNVLEACAQTVAADGVIQEME
ncbi:MAG: Zn-dependent protease with chaperone function, partial [Verrucomicrobia bacterium]